MKFSKKLTMVAVAALALVGTAACSKRQFIKFIRKDSIKDY